MRGSSAPDGSVEPDDSDPITIVPRTVSGWRWLVERVCEHFAAGESRAQISTAIANADHFATLALASKVFTNVP